MKTLQGVKGPLGVIAVLCLVVLIGPTAKAQLRKTRFIPIPLARLASIYRAHTQTYMVTGEMSKPS